MSNTTLSITPLLRQLDAAEMFSPFASRSWALWLDSCDSEHPDCQYDIMVWQPKITLTTTSLITKINWLDPQGNITQSQQSTDDPLTLVKHYQQTLFTNISLPTTHLPFVGGALGYLSYDLGRRFENLPCSAIRDIDIPEMAMGIYDRAIIIDHKAHQTWLVCPQIESAEINQQLIELYKNSSADPNSPPTFQLTNAWQSNMDKQAYQKKFEQVQDYLLSGDCYQINLAQRFSANYQGDEFQAYLALRTANNAPFSAFMRFDNAVILSISPERFLQVNNGYVQSKPIKGTRARNSDQTIDKQNAQDLACASKDQAENLMIVDLLRNDLSKSCVAGSVTVPELFKIESFSAVHHLVSTVEGKLANGKDAIDVIRAAFPGGSITGAPKIRAMEIIEQLEPHRRSIYCGAIGYISACGKMDTNITIRTLVCHKNKIYCWAGGGLVADSILNSEYQETFDKVSQILPTLALSSILSTTISSRLSTKSKK